MIIKHLENSEFSPFPPLFSILFFLFRAYKHGKGAREMHKTWVIPQMKGGYPSLMLK
jgi:hypothetical protein